MNKLTHHATTELRYGFVFFLVLFGVIGLYWVGLNGIFLLDDEPNLSSLEKISDLTFFKDISVYITEGLSSRLGRPISLLTFGLQFYDFPNNIIAFKYVNLMIHLLNGCLIFWLALLLTRFLTLSHQRSLCFAFLTASLWLVHPLQVSTVLYVVQRMTELATLFTVASLLVYLAGRQRLAKGQLISGFIQVSLSIVIGGILAVLSKENGVLLVFYVWVLEVTLLQTLAKPPYWRIWLIGFIYLPITLLLIYLTIQANNVSTSHLFYGFTVGERLLTETRILWDYVTHILLLRPFGFDFGLFHDDYTISHSLFDPLITLFTVTGILLISWVAWQWRRTYPVFAFGILWFLAGHLLESSFILLVLYFEHRNYLPMLGIVFASLYGGIILYEQMDSRLLRKVAIGLSMLWCSAFPLLTWSQTTLWGNPLVQVSVWAEQKPQSRYAQSHLAAIFEKIGRPDEAIKRYQQMVEIFPNDTGPYMLWLSLACTHQDLAQPNMQQVLQRFRTGKVDSATISALIFLLRARINGHCEIAFQTLETVFNTLLQNPNTTIYQASLSHLQAVFYAYEKRYTLAITHLTQALVLENNPQWRLEKIAWLVLDNQVAEAAAYLQETRQAFNPIQLNLYAKDLEHWQTQIIAKQNPMKVM